MNDIEIIKYIKTIIKENYISNIDEESLILDDEINSKTKYEAYIDGKHLFI